MDEIFSQTYGLHVSHFTVTSIKSCFNVPAANITLHRNTNKQLWIGYEQENGTVENKLSALPNKHCTGHCKWQSHRGISQAVNTYIYPSTCIAPSMVYKPL